jgi:predicted ribosomally synthesized peptide with SipW-like signal peptide
MDAARQPNERRRRSKLLAAMAVVGMLGVVVGVTWAAFNSAATNAGNKVESGTVKLEDNDSGSALFSLSGVEPGDTDTGCIKVTYKGSLASEVRLYGTTTGAGLGVYASLTVTRGSYTPSEPGFDSCANFTPDATTYVSGQSPGVVYAGTLQGFPDTYAGGVVDPSSGSPEAWTTDEHHVYKLQITVGDNRAAEGKDVTQTFTWEARNS